MQTATPRGSPCPLSSCAKTTESLGRRFGAGASIAPSPGSAVWPLPCAACEVHGVTARHRPGSQRMITCIYHNSDNHTPTFRTHAHARTCAHTRSKSTPHKCTDTDTHTQTNLVRYQTCTLCMHTHTLHTALRLHSSLRQILGPSLRLGEQPDEVVLGQHAAHLWRVCAGRGTQGHVQKERQRVCSAVCSAHCSSGRAPGPLPGREQGARRVRGAGVSVAYPER